MDPESRFAHLLQPIRDVAENFNIDLAHELEEYLSELESISISFDGGKTQLNFAEGNK
jgi:condensin-2 complex subunit H2